MLPVIHFSLPGTWQTSDATFNTPLIPDTKLNDLIVKKFIVSVSHIMLIYV